MDLEAIEEKLKQIESETAAIREMQEELLNPPPKGMWRLKKFKSNGWQETLPKVHFSKAEE